LAVSVAASAAARASGDVPEALRADPRASDLLRGVAACWEVAEGSGAGLASSLTTLADSAREVQRVRDELRAGLAEPRATAVVLACLPLLGLALGSLLGADPLAWLLGSPGGAAVLATGAALEVVGSWWAWRIAASLESSV
jgi:tight adherence protein B